MPIETRSQATDSGQWQGRSLMKFLEVLPDFIEHQLAHAVLDPNARAISVRGPFSHRKRDFKAQNGINFGVLICNL